MKQTSATQELSEHGKITAPGTIRVERLLRGPVDRVWVHLTEPDKLGKWLAPGSTAARPGGVVALTWHHDQLSPQHPEPIPEEYKKHQGTVSRWRSSKTFSRSALPNPSGRRMPRHKHTTSSAPRSTPGDG